MRCTSLKARIASRIKMRFSIRPNEWGPGFKIHEVVGQWPKKLTIQWPGLFETAESAKKHIETTLNERVPK
jgi:hypothetical protein